MASAVGVVSARVVTVGVVTVGVVTVGVVSGWWVYSITS